MISTVVSSLVAIHGLGIMPHDAMLSSNVGATLSKTTGGVGKGVVFLAWGAWAGKRVAKLSKKKHLILTSAVRQTFL